MVVEERNGGEEGVHHIWWLGSGAGETLDVGWGVDKLGKGVHLLGGGWSEQPSP